MKVLRAISYILLALVIGLVLFQYFNADLFLYYEYQPIGEYDFNIPIGRENILLYEKYPAIAFVYDNQGFLFFVLVILAILQFYENYKKNKDK